jgi:hypothetical protein
MTDSPAPKTAVNPGKLAVAGILLLAVALAGFAWWWNWQRTRRCREFYGGEGAHLIRTATQVEGLTLSELFVREARQQVVVGTQSFDVVDHKDLSQVHGLIHARTALLDDSSYQWENQTVGDCQPKILYAVRFHQGDQQITLAFDFGCHSVHVVETHKEVVLETKIASGWESFLQRQMAEPTRESR